MTIHKSCNGQRGLKGGKVMTEETGDTVNHEILLYVAISFTCTE